MEKFYKCIHSLILLFHIFGCEHKHICNYTTINEIFSIYLLVFDYGSFYSTE